MVIVHAGNIEPSPGSICISASRQDRDEIPAATPMFSATGSSMALRSLLRDVTGSRDFNMAVCKPEVFVSPPLDSGHTYVFRYGQFNSTIR